MTRAHVSHDFSLDVFVSEWMQNERLRRMRKMGTATAGPPMGLNPWTMTAIARKLGVSVTCVSYWESGRHYPVSLTEWNRWSWCFNKGLRDVLGEVEGARQ